MNYRFARDRGERLLSNRGLVDFAMMALMLFVFPAHIYEIIGRTKTGGGYGGYRPSEPIE